jgi:hypothetical protein
MGHSIARHQHLAAIGPHLPSFAQDRAGSGAYGQASQPLSDGRELDLEVGRVRDHADGDHPGGMLTTRGRAGRR